MIDPAGRRMQEGTFAGRIRIALLNMLLCLAVVSCQPADTHTTSGSVRETGSLRQTSTAQTRLSREQIIEAANAAARERGWWPKSSRIFYDEGNAIWNFHWEGDFQNELAGHDYQAVIYRHLPLAVPFGGDLWVAVDRNTGTILKVIQQP